MGTFLQPLTVSGDHAYPTGMPAGRRGGGAGSSRERGGGSRGGFPGPASRHPAGGHVAASPRRGRSICSALPLSATLLALTVLAEPGLAAETAVSAVSPVPVPAVPDMTAAAAPTVAVAWWIWPLALFVVCFVLGIVAVPAGVGGGVLFVPIVGGFFPFHLDFVRGAGLLVALASALAAGPALLRNGLASLRLALPLALLASTSSIAGAMIGLALPADVVNVALGATILGIVALMALARKSEFPQVNQPDRIAASFGMHGIFHDVASSRDVDWKVHRTPLGLALFVLIGMLAGMFGLGAGWANVPVLNLLMGAPLKVSAGSSSFILSLVDSSAAWVYLNKGAVLAVIAVPSVMGMMLGARIGARLLHVLKASVVRRLVITLLLFAGLRAILKGLGVWP